MKNEQHKNDETLEMIKEIRTSILIKKDDILEMIKEIRTSILIKKDDILDKKKRSKLRYNSKRIETKIIIFNIYETRKVTIYKRLSR